MQRFTGFLLLEHRADHKYIQAVTGGRAECKRLGESETVCVFVIDAACAAGATQEQLCPRRLPANLINRISSQPTENPEYRWIRGGNVCVFQGALSGHRRPFLTCKPNSPF